MASPNQEHAKSIISDANPRNSEHDAPELNQFPKLFSLPRELRDAIYYLYLLHCKRQLCCMAAGYNQWPTPKLLTKSSRSSPTSVGYNQWPSPKNLAKPDRLLPTRWMSTPLLTYPLEIENFFLTTPHTVAPHRESYRESPEKTTNLMCVSRSIREEAEEVLYGRFIFCFQYGLHQAVANRFVSETSPKALSHLSTMAFVIRFYEAAPNDWQTWEENSEIMSRGFGGLRMVFFEIQVSREASKTMGTEAKDGVITKLLTVAQPFIKRPDIKTRWVGMDLGGTLAGLCQDEFAKGDHCC